MKQRGVGIRTIVGVAVLASALAGGFGRTSEVRAAVASRGDPIVHLSNGVVLDVGVIVNDAASDVSSLQYTVHTPQNVGITSVVYPVGDAFAAKERFIVQPDNVSRTYTTYGILQTFTPNQTYTLYTNVVGYAPASASGSTGQTVIVIAHS